MSPCTYVFEEGYHVVKFFDFSYDPNQLPDTLLRLTRHCVEGLSLLAILIDRKRLPYNLNKRLIKMIV